MFLLLSIGAVINLQLMLFVHSVVITTLLFCVCLPQGIMSYSAVVLGASGATGKVSNTLKPCVTLLRTPHSYAHSRLHLTLSHLCFIHATKCLTHFTYSLFHSFPQNSSQIINKYTGTGEGVACEPQMEQSDYNWEKSTEPH